MAAIWVEMNCPEHGLERFKIKIIKKYNVNKELIEPRFREKPRHELAGYTIGKNVNYEDVREQLKEYYKGEGTFGNLLSMRLQV